MAFDAPTITIVGLAKFELPAHTIRLCDGAFTQFGGETYTSDDPDFGTIQSVDVFNDQVNDEAPGGSLTFLPKDTAAAATLSSPAFQSSRMRFWLAQVDTATGAVTSAELVYDGLLDATVLRASRGSRALDVDFISVADRLFNINDGNTLSSRFHKSVWPNEAGFDNATGTLLTVAWGVEGPPRGSVYNYGGGGSGGGGGGARLYLNQPLV